MVKCWCCVIGPLKFIPKVFSEVQVWALCRLVKFFHTIHWISFIHRNTHSGTEKAPEIHLNYGNKTFKNRVFMFFWPCSVNTDILMIVCLTDGAMFSGPALMAFTFAVLAGSVLSAAWVTRFQIAYRTSPTLLTATASSYTHTVRATVHCTHLCKHK